MKRKAFGQNIEPRCEYCQNGHESADGRMILCPRKGIVERSASCRKFCYDPLRRIPRTAPPLPVFSDDDFSLETNQELML